MPHLYIMRHGEAESGEQLDPTRELTSLGKRQAKMMGKWFSRQSERPELVIESNMRRSIQTAKRVAKQLDCPIVRSFAIDPDGNPETAWNEIKRLGKEAGAEYVLAISHGPLVQMLITHLIGGGMTQYIHFSHATIAHLEATSGKRGILHWMVSPNTVARDEEEMQNVTRNAKALAEASLSLAELLVVSAAASPEMPAAEEALVSLPR